MPVEMELARILINERDADQYLVLREKNGERYFTIVIGRYEADVIERRLKNRPILRPQAHELLSQMIDALGGRLEKIEINDLKEGTFFAKLVIRKGQDVVEVDSRPSDAIALGVAGNVPIFVQEHVLEEAGVEPPGA